MIILKKTKIDRGKIWKKQETHKNGKYKLIQTKKKNEKKKTKKQNNMAARCSRI